MILNDGLKVFRSYLRADMPAMLLGAPGVGKTEGIEDTARECGFEPLTESLATMESVDLRGLPSLDGQGGVVWSKPDFLCRLERLKQTTGRDVLLFIDEANANSQSVQVPLMQLALKRAIGPHELPAGTRLAFAGNRLSDRAAAQRMATAFNNRVGIIEIDSPANADGVKGWSQWAAAKQIHPMVIAFIMLRGAATGHEGKPGYLPGLLHCFDPSSQEPSFASPRSWAAVSRVMPEIEKESKTVFFNAVKGIVGNMAATEFEGFREVYSSIPPVMSIISNPGGAKVPDMPGAQFAVSLALARAANPSNFSAVLQYMQRVGREFEIVTATDAIRRNPDLTDTPAFVQWAARNSDVTI